MFAFNAEFTFYSEFFTLRCVYKVVLYSRSIRVFSKIFEFVKKLDTQFHIAPFATKCLNYSQS